MKTADILTYKRTDSGNMKNYIFAEIMLAVMGVLAGRVELWGTVMPTGIGWVIANIKKNGKEKRLLTAIAVSGIGMLLGGMDIFKIRAFATLGVLYVAAKFDIFGKNTLAAGVFGAAVNLVCGCIITAVSGGDELGYLMLIIEALLIIGSAVVFDNFTEIVLRGGSVLTEDEGVSMFVAAGVIAAGLEGIGVGGIEISAIVSMYMIIFTSKKCGFGIAVTLAAVLGIATGGEDTVSTLGLYIFLAMGCSLLGGTGKWGTVMGAASANAIFIACKMGLDGSVVRVIEIAAAITAFYFTPENVMNKISAYTAKKAVGGMGETKLIMHQRETAKAAEELKEAVCTVSQVVKEMNTHKKTEQPRYEIIKKIKGTVCSECALKKYCLEKNFARTEQTVNRIIDLFSEYGSGFEAEKTVLHKQTDWKCIHAQTLVSTVRDSFEFYLKNEIEREKLAKNREYIINGLEEMAEIIERRRKRINENYISLDGLEEEIFEALTRNGIQCFGICVVKNRYGLYEVTAELAELTTADAEKIIKEVMGVSMKTVSEEKSTKGLVLCMREKEHFEYETAVMSIDNKERRTGDTTTVFDDGKGSLYCMVSDGMGSGALAAKESGWTVKLYEKLCRAGFEQKEVIRIINNVMISAKTGESCVSTDSIKINLLTGNAEFVKAGAASSYIKTKRGAEKIGWSSLPLGILEIGEAEPGFCDISDGGFIVMMSDGVPDTAGDRMEGEHRLRRCIEQCDGETAGEMAENVMLAAMTMGAPKDDMTVLVIKLIKK